MGRANGMKGEPQPRWTTPGGKDRGTGGSGFRWRLYAIKDSLPLQKTKKTLTALTRGKI